MSRTIKVTREHKGFYELLATFGELGYAHLFLESLIESVGDKSVATVNEDRTIVKFENEPSHTVYIRIQEVGA